METCGIFDIKWNPVGSSSCQLLGQADADGYLRVYKLASHSDGASESAGAITLREVSDVKVSTSMCLYLDWNPSATAVAIGISDGSVAVVSVTESGLSLHQQWEGHQFEVWTSSFDCHLPHLVYTGSDDCRFCGWDLRDDPSSAAFQNTKAHSAGVCCITKNPNDPNTLLTGSYDEYLRVWDMRSLSKPVNEKSLCLGGGVWRLKYHPSIPDLVLSACMHNGFAIVDTKSSMLEIVETYTKHESLAYGADWQRRKLGNDNADTAHVVATCSFYDKLLRIWRPLIKNCA
uniref:methylated diphthine methylhydrolase n=1 Tax=Kalanchoe fedtschenkoi TaxID=63787 RepID=A0A7N0TZU2_KALFE